MAENFFKWDREKLTTYVDAMDDEHQKLISLMNQLYTQYEAKASHSELSRILKELAAWTVTHFEHEEKFFDKLPYDRAAVHKHIHQTLLADLKKHQAEFEKSKVLSPDFFIFLKTWLTAHIIGVDKKYGMIAICKTKSA